MPMDFPDMDSLKAHAKYYDFRQPNEGETEAEYRTALANCVEPKDFVEACEIRNKVGWDKFTPEQSASMVQKRFRK